MMSFQESCNRVQAVMVWPEQGRGADRADYGRIAGLRQSSTAASGNPSNPANAF
jgi:hypothetical protein